MRSDVDFMVYVKLGTPTTTKLSKALEMSMVSILLSIDESLCYELIY